MSSYRGRTFRKHLKKGLGMKSGVSDAPIFKTSGESLIVLCATYVDDIFACRKSRILKDVRMYRRKV